MRSQESTSALPDSQQPSAADVRSQLAALLAEQNRRRWLADPVLWAKERLGRTLWSAQRRIIEAVRDNRHVSVRSSFATGKCLDVDERLMLADGRVLSAGELLGHYFALPAFAEDGSQPPALAWATDNGSREVLEISTQSGRTIRRTGNHPLLVGWRSEHKPGQLVKVRNIGWTHIDKIKEGDLVMVPLRLDVSGGRPAETSDVKLLGYLLGDGGTSRYAVTFTQEPGEQLDEFVEIVTSLGCVCKKAGPLGLRVTGSGKDGEHNEVLNRSRKWGLQGKLSKQKSFPTWAWELPNEQLALLLNRLYSCDGWVSIPSRASRTGQQQGVSVHVGICLASERLLRDVELALLRLGINGTVRRRVNSSHKGGEKKFTSWELKITRLADMERFRDTVGIIGKQEKLVRACWLKSASGTKAGRRGGRTSKWDKLECPDGYRWDTVVSVKSLGVRQTVTVSVEHHHTFVSTFVEHNSFVAATLAAWWTDVHPPGQSFVVTTASTEAQVKAILWHELAIAHAAGRLPGKLNQTEWWMEVNNINQMVGFGRKPADTNAVAFQGIHRKYVLVIIDEAAGVVGEIWDAAEGLAANEHSRILAIGNPEDPLSEFAEVSKPGSGWVSMKISAFDTPAFTGEQVPQVVLDNLVSKVWVEERGRRWGVDSPKYIAKVLGEFPEISDNCLILPSWVIAAQARTVEPMRPSELGVDVGAGGDRTVIALRRGNHVRIIHRGRQRNTMEASGDVVRAINKYGIEVVKIDEIGVGKGVADRATELHNQKNILAKIIGVNVGKAPDRRAKRRGKREVDEHDESEQFLNRRAQAYWRLRELFQMGEIDIDPNDEDLAAQLIDIRYERLSNGVIKIESKEEMKRRGRDSPDEADAVMMAFLDPVGLQTRRATWGSGGKHGAAGSRRSSKQGSRLRLVGRRR